jgi:DNA topoisomerase IB
LTHKPSPKTRGISDLALEFFSILKGEEREKRRVRLMRKGTSKKKPLKQFLYTKPDEPAVKDC